MLDYFTAKTNSGHVPVTLLTPDTLGAWRTANAALAGQLDHINFNGKPNESAILRTTNGAIEHVLFGVSQPLRFYDVAALPAVLAKSIPAKILENASFTITNDLNEDEESSVITAWALGSDQIKKDKSGKSQTLPILAVSMDGGYQYGESMTSAILMLRELVNLPSNLLGPDELEAAALKVANEIKATSQNVIKDGELLEQNFPLVYTVGQASHRRPRLIEFTWGDPNHPRVALVGKGVCFDTGGLDIKSADGMRQMKKDMGGAAHVLALAKLIVDARLPVHLHVIIPAVENSIDGNAYRPGDVYKSRKGLTVEIGNTDAEGRLILCDAMVYAMESKPDLLINYATLTGAARMAMGPDIVPVFANKKDTGYALQNTGLECDDPVWHMPLWAPYREELDSDVADIGNVGGKAGMITAALYLQAFVGSEQDWIHLDIYAGRDSAKPGRPKSGFETGLRAVFIYLKERYAKK